MGGLEESIKSGLLLRGVILGWRVLDGVLDEVAGATASKITFKWKQVNKLMSCNRGKASPDLYTRTKLFSASAGYCQNPDCLRGLFLELEKNSIHIAEMAHIFAANDKGPRANKLLDDAARGDFNNLILLCPSCHTIVDKSPADFPDALITAWKGDHDYKIRAAFGIASYTTRDEVRNAIAPLLRANRHIHANFGPDNDYRLNPESEEASHWKRKVVGQVIPNSLSIIKILDINKDHLNSNEKDTVESFRQHIDDISARHLEGVESITSRFPPEMNNILED